MKLVDIAEFYSEQGGGVRTYINQKFAYCAKNGIELVLIAPGAEDRVEERTGGRIYWVKSWQIPVDQRYYFFRKKEPIYELLDQEQPDVVEGSSPWRGGAIAANWQGSAVKSFFVHSDPVASYPETFLTPVIGATMVRWSSAWFWRYLRKLTDKYDTSIVAGNWLADRFAGFGISRPMVIPLGLEKMRFSPKLRDMDIRAQMLAKCGLGPSAKLFVAISRYHPEKRVPAMIRAVAAANQTQDIGLVIVGDGLSRQKISKIANKVQHVHLTGAITDRDFLPRLLASADGFLHGCSSETFCIVAGEALCCGVPLVVPNAGGAADMAKAGFSESWRAGNIIEGRDAILRLVNRERSDLSRAASLYAQQHLCTPDQHFDALFAHYQNLVIEKQGKEGRT